MTYISLLFNLCAEKTESEKNKAFSVTSSTKLSMDTLKKGNLLKDLQTVVISEILGSNTLWAFMTHSLTFFYASQMLDFKEINLFTSRAFIRPENKMPFFFKICGRNLPKLGYISLPLKP